MKASLIALMFVGMISNSNAVQLTVEPDQHDLYSHESLSNHIFETQCPGHECTQLAAEQASIGYLYGMGLLAPEKYEEYKTKIFPKVWKKVSGGAATIKGEKIEGLLKEAKKEI